MLSTRARKSHARRRSISGHDSVIMIPSINELISNVFHFELRSSGGPRQFRSRRVISYFIERLYGTFSVRNTPHASGARRRSQACEAQMYAIRISGTDAQGTDFEEFTENSCHNAHRGLV